MKYIPISVFVPGDGYECGLTPTEAKNLILRAQRQLALWEKLKAVHGPKGARLEMMKHNDRTDARRRGRG